MRLTRSKVDLDMRPKRVIITTTEHESARVLMIRLARYMQGSCDREEVIRAYESWQQNSKGE